MTTDTTIDLDPTTRPTLSVEEAAGILGIGRSCAYAAVKSGEIPALRLGRRVRVSTAVVRRMLELDPTDA
jgi:excisionase family DNA binding protein